MKMGEVRASKEMISFCAPGLELEAEEAYNVAEALCGPK